MSENNEHSKCVMCGKPAASICETCMRARATPFAITINQVPEQVVLYGPSLYHKRPSCEM